MQKVEIICDQCGKDLTWTGNCEDYRIALANEAIRSVGGVVTSMAIRPPLKGGTAHFCGVPCLGKWVSEKYPDAIANYAKHEERRARSALTPTSGDGK